MTEEKKQNLYDLKASLKDELENNKEELKKMSEDERYDWLQETIDGYLPVYTAHALEIALFDLWLAVDKAEYEGNAYEQIVANIASALREEADEWLKNNLE